jgi:uncharacterized protein (TIGR00369 family)
MKAPQSIWRPGVTLAHCNALSAGTMLAHTGIVFTELGAAHVSATMPVDERTCQPMRQLHGGASVVLAESLASVAANCTLDFTVRAAVGQEINANHLRPVAVGGAVTGTARPVHLGNRTQVWSVEIVDERGKLVCVSRITMAVIDREVRA